MSDTKTELPDYWSVYKAINFKRFSTSREFTDAKTGKRMTYELIGTKEIRESFILSLFSMILWMSPAFIIILLSAIFGYENPAAYIYGVIAVIGYHFAGMYYCIRGPIIKISPVKKGIFSRK